MIETAPRALAVTYAHHRDRQALCERELLACQRPALHGQGKSRPDDDLVALSTKERGTALGRLIMWLETAIRLTFTFA
jgi:hypothetical protein